MSKPGQIDRKKIKIVSIVGARPNFMKIAPLCEEFQKNGINHVLIHTGQHYDQLMSKLFFQELAIPEPDVNLNVGSGTHAQQTAEIMARLEPILEKENPSMVVVVGDVNSTMAAAITAAKQNIPVAHVESGLRSFDKSMPEEINRLLTDAISDLHFTTEESANINLSKEGISEDRIFFVGNTMIDTLLKQVEKAEQSPILECLGIERKKYGIVTLHRPSNVDCAINLQNVLEALNEIARETILIFPIHPRTRSKIALYDLEHLVKTIPAKRIAAADGQTKESKKPGNGKLGNGLFIVDPLGYLSFLKLMKEASIMFTDSGGIQEETTVLGIPCVTLRDNTERPTTINYGANVLVGADRTKIVTEARKRLSGACNCTVPPLWDGNAAKRIVDVIIRYLTSD